MPYQLGSGSTPPPGPTPSSSVWEQIRRAFSGTRGFFNKIGVIFGALYALSMASLRWTLTNLAKTAIVIVIAIGGISIVAALIWFLSDHVRLIGLLIGFILLVVILRALIKHFRAKSSFTINKKPVAIKDLISYLVFTALVVGSIFLGFYYFGLKFAWIFLAILVSIILLVAARGYTKKNYLIIIRDFFWQPAFFIVVGIAVLNGIFWAIAPTTWKYIWADSARFWIINFGAWVGLCLLLVPEDKDRKARYALARGLSVVILGGVIATLIVLVIKANVDFGNTSTGIISITPTKIDKSYSVPAEIAIPIICGCESSGIPGIIQHYESDGITPLKNKPKPGEEPTTAIGGCQIISSLHEKRAKEEFGLDIRTPEGNLAYAKILYRDLRTGPWDDSATCWEPKLKAYTWGGEVVSMVVMAPVGERSNNIRTPYSPRKWRIEGGGKKYYVLWNEGRKDEAEEILPRPEGAVVKKPEVVYSFRFKSAEPEEVPITVKFF